MVKRLDKDDTTRRHEVEDKGYINYYTKVHIKMFTTENKEKKTWKYNEK